MYGISLALLGIATCMVLWLLNMAHKGDDPPMALTGGQAALMVIGTILLLIFAFTGTTAGMMHYISAGLFAIASGLGIYIFMNAQQSRRIDMQMAMIDTGVSLVGLIVLLLGR